MDKNKGINVLSLFDGMSCGQIALKELGVKVDNYYASEIDKFAIKQTQHNFPNTIQLGSVVDIKAKDLNKIDLLIGGSPCQGFSFAGKQLNFDDPRSALFFEFVRIWKEVKEINPDAKFLLENVNMKKNHLAVISKYMGVFPVRINSNLVSAQNRDRWYWTNIKTKKVGLFEDLTSDIPQPKDKGILLKDILLPESEVADKFYLSESATDGLLRHKERADKNGWGFGAKLHKDNDKFNALKVGGTGKDDIYCVAIRGRETACLTPRRTDYGKQIRKDYEAGKIKTKRKNIQQLEPRNDGKTNTITSVQKDNLILLGGISNGKINKGISSDFSQGARIYSPEGKSTTINSSGGGQGGKTGLYLIQKSHGFNKGGVFKDKTPTVLSNSWEHNNHITDGYKLRRLTPIECARLQTIPEWYIWIVSDNQTYRMLGNGWTVEVIKHIFQYLNVNING